ncbi:hypothetical protein LINGRAHAP2_LOCUS2101 [Linum grandiflorum]
MKWFIDEEGWPKTSQVTREEMDNLISGINDLQIPADQTDPYVEDIYDEFILPENSSPPVTEGKEDLKQSGRHANKNFNQALNVNQMERD